MFQLPMEILQRIFEFDSTYHQFYQLCLDEIPDEAIAQEHKRHYLDLQTKERREIRFYIDTLSGDQSYLYIGYFGFSYFGNFTHLTYVSTEGVKRFMYDNQTVEDSREDGIDTRLRDWEWWITLSFDNNPDRATPEPVCVSCEYHQIHGCMLQVYSINSKSAISYPIQEREAKILCRSVRSALLTSDLANHYTTIYGDYPLNGQCCVIPNAMHRIYML